MDQVEGKIRLKHLASCAWDADIGYRIVRAERSVELAVLGEPQFIPVTLLQGFLTGRLARDYGIRAWDSDEVAGLVPNRTGWRVYLTTGGLRFQVRLVKQLLPGAGWVMELRPTQ